VVVLAVVLEIVHEVVVVEVVVPTTVVVMAQGREEHCPKSNSLIRRFFLMLKQF
jgi:hypothetical protein